MIQHDFKYMHKLLRPKTFRFIRKERQINIMVKKLFGLEQVTEMVSEPVHSILSVIKGWTRAWLMVSRLEGSIIRHFSKKSFSWLTFFKCFSSLNFWLPRRAESSSRLCDKLVMTVTFSCERKMLYLCTVHTWV